MQKTFVVKVKKSDAPKENVIPMHPEFSYNSLLTENMWEAKNMATGEKVRVSKKEKEKFVEYEIEEIA